MSKDKRDAFIRRCNRWDYLVVQSNRASEITASCYAFKKAFLRTGYPRNDILFSGNTPENIARLKRERGIPEDKKVILYAPTWRIKNAFHISMDLVGLRQTLGEEYVMLVRVHPFSAPGLDPGLFDEKIYNATDDPYVEELYLIADMVITDYSSVMFDYAILNRPMLFFVYDLEDYRDNLRGFNFDFLAEAPGPLLKSDTELFAAIADIENVREKYAQAFGAFRQKFCEYEDGTASEKIFTTVIGR